MSSDIISALEPVVHALEELGVAYRVGGSVASSALGVPRSTLDVDIVCELKLAHVDELTKRLKDTFYIDADMVRDAVQRRASFNVLHLATMLKVDVFVRGDAAYDIEVFSRVSRKSLEEGTREFDLTTAEDIILRKLEWYRLGGGVSERQWSDVLGVIRVQAGALDSAFMRRWARSLGVEDLLERALTEGKPPDKPQE